VFKSIDETLAAVFGFAVRDAVYLALLTKYSVTREEVAKRLSNFQKMLEIEFGQRGANVLSRAIAKRLYSELHLTFVEDPAFKLPEYVEAAKSKLLDTNPSKAESLDTEIPPNRKGKPLGEDDLN